MGIAYILIVCLLGHSSFTAKFDNKDACEVAQLQLKQDLPVVYSKCFQAR